MKLKKHYWILECKHGDVIEGETGAPMVYGTKALAAEGLRSFTILGGPHDCKYEPVRLFVTDGTDY